MDNLDEIKEMISMKKNELNDIDKEFELTGPLITLMNALKKIKEIKSVKSNTGIDLINLEVYLSKLTANHQSEHPKYDYTLFPLLTGLPRRPYSKTTDYFGGGIGSLIQIEKKGTGLPQTTIPANDVFISMYPGSISYRFGAYNQIRIPCGQYYEDFVSHLQGLHKLSKSPISTFEDNDVYEIEKIIGIALDIIRNRNHGNIPICPRCLSISVFSGPQREQCDHIRDKTESVVMVKNFQHQPILKTKENIDERKILESKKFTFPLNEIFDKVEFLGNAQIVTVATGFSRQASWGQGANAGHNSVHVKYNPYVGYKMDTNGVIFKIKEIPENFIDQIFDEYFLVRDILIDIFAEKIEKIIHDNDRSIFELELWLSGIIKTLNLDSIDDSFNVNDVLQALLGSNFRENFKNNIVREISYYSHIPNNIGPDIIDIFSQEINSVSISIDDLKLKIKALLKISLSYLAYMSALITSGSMNKDVDFIYPQGAKNDVVIFDSVSNGNGASKLINDYLIGEETSVSQEKGLRSKYFQETLFELLLPCSQGIADRIFFQNLDDNFSNFTRNDLITYRLNELKEQNNSATEEFNQIKNSKIENMFPISIGKRPLQKPDGANVENKKIQEIAHICIHGCPECLLLNSYSGPSIPRLERFYVSKYLLDLYFKFVTEKIRIRSNESISNIEKILNQYGVIIISQKITGTNCDFSDLLTKINSLIGEKFNSKLVKFSGIWFDCPITKPSDFNISILVSVI